MRGRLLLAVAVVVVLAGCSATGFGVGTDPASSETVVADSDEPVPSTRTSADVAAGAGDESPRSVGPAATPDPTRTIRHEGDLVVTTPTRYESVRLVVTGDVVVTDGGSLVLEESVLELGGGASADDPALTVRGQGSLTAKTVAFTTGPAATLAYDDHATVDLRNVSHRTGTTLHRASDDAHLSVTDSQLAVVGADEATVDVETFDCRITVPLPGESESFSFPDGFTADYRFVVSNENTAVTVHVTESIIRTETSDADE
ncbi:hypothetical protein [Haloarchaeobius sp. TZWSO28]|uniref:hypothetical protein n=1 Tax=Haloarchaeobius sp. TZWSO28 TaxID=3446119 RepID=UPI003EBD590D